MTKVKESWVVDVWRCPNCNFGYTFNPADVKLENCMHCLWSLAGTKHEVIDISPPRLRWWKRAYRAWHNPRFSFADLILMYLAWSLMDRFIW